ncbi:MAG: hypothetical protein AAFZ87_06250, partial [Planctomycetota bacterium]
MVLARLVAILTAALPPASTARALPTPVAAGLAMFAFTLWQEYTWFDRSTAVLPEGARVAETYDYASAIQ